MAKVPEAQAKVLEIALGIPDSENSRVYDDVTDIALSLPPALAAKLVPQICRYSESSIKLLLYEKIADLIVHLARGGEAAAALQLRQLDVIAFALGIARFLKEPASMERLKPCRRIEAREKILIFRVALLISSTARATASSLGIALLRF